MQGKGQKSSDPKVKEGWKLPDVTGLGPFAAQDAINKAVARQAARDNEELAEFFAIQEIREEETKKRILREAEENGLLDEVVIPGNLVRERARQVGLGEKLRKCELIRFISVLGPLRQGHEGSRLCEYFSE